MNNSFNDYQSNDIQNIQYIIYPQVSYLLENNLSYSESTKNEYEEEIEELNNTISKMRNSYEVLLSKYNEIQKAMKEEQKMRINNNNDSDNDEQIEEYQRKIEEINDEYNKLLTKFVYIILYYYYL